MTLNRRGFLISFGTSFVAAASALGWRLSQKKRLVRRDIRPPGALPEDEFQRSCIRCGLCNAVCPRGCIQTRPLSFGPAVSGLPFIDTRKRACNLCMACTKVCPTGALEPIPDDKEIVATSVNMGTAVIDESLCISFLGRMCGICRDACPFPGKAIKLEPWARPKIVKESCVGCGLCVEICPQQPTAIRIIPENGNPG